MQVPRLSEEIPFQGPIALECALFCLDCEVIFSDLACCPSCRGSGIWPLARWLSPVESDLNAASLPEGDSHIFAYRAETSGAVA